jgi:hypothetical protein
MHHSLIKGLAANLPHDQPIVDFFQPVLAKRRHRQHFSIRFAVRQNQPGI